MGEKSTGPFVYLYIIDLIGPSIGSVITDNILYKLPTPFGNHVNIDLITIAHDNISHI
jgi:hypothetical protein